VLATDIDDSRAAAAEADNVEIRRHDVGHDRPPDGPFDVVHARLVLVHVAERDAALRNMASVLRPRGALLVEDADPALQPLASLEVRSAHDELANRMRDGFRTLLGARGVDLAYGRKLPRLLGEVGLENVGADAYFPVAMPACVDLELATISLLSRELTNAGLATDAEIERHLENVRKGKVTTMALSPLVSAWGTKP
jgi:SAM-dependent methyltransferase